MTIEQIESVVAELFAQLEAGFSDKPYLLLLLQSLEAAADAVIPTILSNLTKGKNV